MDIRDSQDTSYIMLGIWICQDFPSGYVLSHTRRSPEWQYWSDENHGLGNCAGKEVCFSHCEVGSLLILTHRYQSRAFLLFPMCFNVGVIIGPILGGLLADPAGSYPKLFGDVAFFKKYPYAPPNILSAFFLMSATLGVFFGLKEV